MPEEFDEALNKIEKFIEILDDKQDVDMEDVGIRYKGEIPKGVVGKRGDHDYVVFGAPEDQYFTLIRHQYIVGSIARRFVEEDDTEDGVEISEEMINDAVEAVEAIESNQMDRMEYYLKDKIASESVESHLWYTEGGAISGFSVQRKIFPYEDSFKLSRFNESIQAVISVSWKGQNFVFESFDIESISASTDVEIQEYR